MTLYVENSRYYMHTYTHTQVRTNKLIKVGRHRVNTQKQVAFLYTNNEQSGMNIDKIIYLQWNKEYLGINQGVKWFLHWKKKKKKNPA